MSDQNQSELPLHTPTDVVLAEIRGVANTMSARFDGIEREQNSQRDWLGRLSDAVDRQITAITKFGQLEARLATVETTSTDRTLEIADLKKDIDDIKQANFKRSVFLSLGTAVGGAIVWGLGQPIVASLITAASSGKLHLPH